MDVNCKVELPSQAGCNHIHVTLTYPDGRTEFHQFHLTDFTAIEPTQRESIYHVIRGKILEARARSRTQIKNLLDDQTIQL